MILDYLIRLIGAYLTDAVVSYWLWPLAMGYFVVAVPGFIKFLTTWR